MPTTKKCVVWGTPADYIETNFDGFDIYSPRAGGRYKITGTASVSFQNNHRNDIGLKENISLSVYESQGLEEPILIDTKMLDEFTKYAPIKPLEKAERLLRYMSKRSPALNIVGLRWGPKINGDELEVALAASGCAYDGELHAILEYLVRRGFCDTTIDQARGEGSVWLTLEGAQHVAEGNTTPTMSDRAFIAMWFSQETQEAYELGIKPAVMRHNFQSVRIDQKEHNNKIDDEIISEIRKSRFLVADFTCGKISADGCEMSIPRGGVYFEAGFAMGLGIPVIWCCRRDLIKEIHFDTRQYNHVVWHDPSDLRTKLTNRIGAVIGPHAKN